MATATLPPGCSAWLGDSFIAELLVHGKPTEVSASALDAFLGVELEAVAVEEWSGRQTGVGGDTWSANGQQPGLDALVETTGNTPTGERGMSEKKVEVAIMGVGSEAGENAVRLGDDGVKPRQALLPACGIRWDWCPRGNLLRRVIRRSQRADRSGVGLDNAWQVGGLIWPFVHRRRVESPNAKVSDGSQPPMTFDSSLSGSAGSRSLHRLVRRSSLNPLNKFGP